MNIVIDEVNEETILIEPIVYGDKIFSRVLEVGREFTVPCRPLEIIEYSCQYFASSYHGRVAGTQSLLNISHKVPIIIEFTTSLIAFPTSSPSRDDCSWLFFDHIREIKKTELHQTILQFHNKVEKLVPVSVPIIKNQMLRSAMLKSKVMQNLNKSIRHRRTD